MSGNGDYISREAANEACRESVRRYPNSFYNGIEAARDAICHLPAADVRPKWISVKERLPELHDAEYLDEVTGELIRYKESKPIMIWLEKGGFMDIGVYEKSDAVDDFCYQGVPATVTYWLPLPEPPKEK